MFKKIGTRKGYTLGQSVSFESMALMSGAQTRVVVHPRYEKGFSIGRPFQEPVLFNEASVVDASQRMTQIGFGGDRVMLVEHLLSALFGMGIDSAYLEVSGPEIPIFDGSASVFAKAISTIEKHPAADVDIYELVEPFSFEDGASQYLLTPLKGGYKWHCVIDYTSVPSIGLQHYDFDSASSFYLSEVSPARTFCLEQEAEMMKAKGLIQGASLENGVVFTPQGPLNPEGLRYPNEPARHKLLDLLGDLAPMGLELHFQGVAIKPGHKANNSLAKIIREKLV
jgi:UDP-3-O-acyl N-acetylglucosamine deacetylase